MNYLKKLIKIGIFSVLGLSLLSTVSNAQERGNDEARVSPNASVSQTIGTTKITVTYGRPGIKDRTYFAEGSVLAPVGSVWRTGANESVAITFSDDVMVGDKKVEAGTYSLYTIPGEDEWTVIVNNKLSWGTEYDEAEDYVRTTTSNVNNDASNVEWFQIYFDSLTDTKANLNLHWGTTKVAIPISIPEM